MEVAHFYRILAGSLKYTGTDILVRSFPIESLIIVHTLILILGSLKNGRTSLAGGSFSSITTGVGTTTVIYSGYPYSAFFSSSIAFVIRRLDEGIKSSLASWKTSSSSTSNLLADVGILTS
jgi:hypothetical protein